MPTKKPSEEKKHMMYFPNEANTKYDNCQNLYDYLLEKNFGHFNDTAITFNNTKITYEELHDNINKYAIALYKKGVRKGDIIGLCVANTPEAIYLFYAINKLGAISCQINPTDNAFRIMKDLEIVKPKMIITINDCYSTLKRANKSLEDKIDLVVFPAVQSVDNDLVKFLYGMKQILSGNGLIKLDRSLIKLLKDAENYNGSVEFPKYEKDSLSNIIFTGGSSGTHKGVDLSSNGLNNLMDSYSYFNLLEPGDVFLGNLPQFMGFGILSLHYALCSNTNLNLTFKALPKDFIEELDRVHPQAAFGVPIHWETLIDNSEALKLDLKNLKEPISGGEQLVLDKWIKINEVLKKCNAPTTLWNGLGMSEMWAASALNRGNINSIGTVGVVYPCNNVKIMDLNSETELGYNCPGRYYVTGPALMLGYHNNLEETSKVIKVDENGVKWLETGDIAEINSNGEITFRGRTKRCFVSGVTNIYPEQIEDIVSKIDGIKQVIVTHVECLDNQNVPIYHIRLDENIQNMEKISKKVKEIIKNTLGDSALPYEIEYTYEALPLTKNGKLDPKPLQAKDEEKYVKILKRKK